MPHVVAVFNGFRFRNRLTAQVAPTHRLFDRFRRGGKKIFAPQDAVLGGAEFAQAGRFPKRGSPAKPIIQILMLARILHPSRLASSSFAHPSSKCCSASSSPASSS